MNQKKVWDKIAPQWNEYRTTPKEDVKKFLKNKSGKLLDVGCGSGRNFFKNKDLQIYGIDISPEMIDLAKEKKLTKELKIMKRGKIPYKEKLFDVIICIAVLHCIKSKRKRQKLIKEIYRVLKPNKKAFISVWSKKHPRLKNKKKFHKLPWNLSKKQKVWRDNYIYTKDELENELKEAGFKILEAVEEKNINIIIKKN